MAEKVGVYNRLWVSPGAADSGTFAELEFMEGSQIGLTEQFVNARGMNGTRVELAARTRQGNRQTQGQLVCAPTPAELDLLLEWATGGTKSGSNIDVSEGADVPARWLTTYRDGTYELYDGVKVGAWSIQASEGAPLQMSLGLQGKDESSDSAPTTPTVIDTAAGPYVMTDCVLSVGGTEYPFNQFSLQCDNRLQVRFNNSQTPTAIHSTGFGATVQLSLPLGDASAVYGSSADGVAVVATFTNGARSLTITLAAVQAPRQPKPFGTRQALDLSWAGEVRKTGSSPIIRFANDSTG
jgi:tail tube protein